jgi:hypothetical protein
MSEQKIYVTITKLRQTKLLIDKNGREWTEHHSFKEASPVVNLFAGDNLRVSDTAGPVLELEVRRHIPREEVKE